MNLTKQELTEIFDWELPVFVKVMKAVPEDYYLTKPAEKSRTPQELINTMIVEMQYMVNFLKGLPATGQEGWDKNLPKFSSVAEASAYFENLTKEFGVDLTAAADEQLNKEVTFFHRQATTADAIFNMFLDLVHHRGQMSVYIRLAGGKLPSIYGPSADEPMPS
jgi:uncharacterized damage-inducible protein DinB